MDAGPWARRKCALGRYLEHRDATSALWARGSRFSRTDTAAIAYTSMGGSQVRVRLSNAFGQSVMNIGAVSIALQGNGSAIMPELDRVLMFRRKSIFRHDGSWCIPPERLREFRGARAAFAGDQHFRSELRRRAYIAFWGQQTNTFLRSGISPSQPACQWSSPTSALSRVGSRSALRRGTSWTTSRCRCQQTSHSKALLRVNQWPGLPLRGHGHGTNSDR